MLDPFASAAATRRPSPCYGGDRAVRAPFSPGFTQFPEHRPFAALDGDLRDVLAGRPRARRRTATCRRRLPAPRDVPYVDAAARTPTGARA